MSFNRGSCQHVDVPGCSNKWLVRMRMILIQQQDQLQPKEVKQYWDVADLGYPCCSNRDSLYRIVSTADLASPCLAKKSRSRLKNNLPEGTATFLPSQRPSSARPLTCDPSGIRKAISICPPSSPTGLHLLPSAN